jgi:hypothetical protein
MPELPKVDSWPHRKIRYARMARDAPVLQSRFVT